MKLLPVLNEDAVLIVTFSALSARCTRGLVFWAHEGSGERALLAAVGPKVLAGMPCLVLPLLEGATF